MRYFLLSFIMFLPLLAAATPTMVVITPHGPVTDHHGGLVPLYDSQGRQVGLTLQGEARGGIANRIICLRPQAEAPPVCTPHNGSNAFWQEQGGFDIGFDADFGALGTIPLAGRSYINMPGRPEAWQDYLPATVEGVYVIASVPGRGCVETVTLTGTTVLVNFQPVPSQGGGSPCDFSGDASPEWHSIAIDLATRRLCPNATTVTPGCWFEMILAMLRYGDDPGSGAPVDITNDRLLADGAEDPVPPPPPQ